ncbi:MAG: sigma-70 family RNA polymerase sigma factor [Chthoniobacterales bacterium]
MTTPKDLIRSMAEGDERALGDLYDANAALLYGLALRILHNEREAEEIVQDVFLAAWRNARSYDPARANVATWLTTLLRNKAIDRLRANRRRLPSQPNESEHLPEPRDPTADPAGAVHKMEVRQRVTAWMAELPPNQRQSVEMAFFDGLTHPEIAKKLGETIGTVKSRVRLGLDHLRRKMKGGVE